MIDFSHFNSIFELTSYFNSEEKCKKVIFESRWNKHDVVCPFCGQHHCTTRTDGRFHCSHCKANFSVTVGTIFENTKIPLVKWFLAMYLISCHKKGISSVQLATDIHVTQKTAWYILHKVRTLFAYYDTPALEGEIELDETYVGGKETNKHEWKRVEGTQGRSTKTKTPVFGMIQRNGNVYAMQVENTKAETLLPIIKQFCIEHSQLFTDELSAYNVLDREGYYHAIIRHGMKEYSKKGVTTNRIEGFWSHFKRMVYGIYHSVSPKFLQQYINESVYRYNTRKISESMRLADMFKKSIKACSYMEIKHYKAVA